MTRTRKLLIALIAAICLLWAARLTQIAQQKRVAGEQAAPAAQQVAVSTQAPQAVVPAQDAAASTQAAQPQQQGAAQPQKQIYAAPEHQLTAPKLSAPQPAAAPLQAKLDILNQILASGNDNDPRLDTSFNDMTQEEKRALESKYAALPREQHNQRGTIVYLLGRDPRTKADWDFLSETAAEPPCQGLRSCDSAEDLPNDHRDIGIELTLSYPSMMALRQAENAVKRGNSAGMAVVRAAAESSSRVVSEEAKRFLKTHGGR